MVRSDQINELAAALAKAQASMGFAERDSNNPFFKSTYADLASHYHACRKALTDNLIAVCQVPFCIDDDVFLETTLMHASGQYISGRLKLKPDKAGPQALGSCLTYYRRYALSAMVGTAADDDDGEAATNHNPPARQEVKPVPKDQRQHQAAADAAKCKAEEAVILGLLNNTEEKSANPLVLDALNRYRSLLKSYPNLRVGLATTGVKLVGRLIDCGEIDSAASVTAYLGTTAAVSDEVLKELRQDIETVKQVAAAKASKAQEI